jgi:predicted DNA-binding transcriptional regulator AlpA
MKNAVSSVPNSVTENALAATEVRPRYADKRAIAEMLGLSVRSVDNFLAEGMPHFALTARCIRFDVEEVRAWLKERYATRRCGSCRTNAVSTSKL